MTTINAQAETQSVTLPEDLSSLKELTLEDGTKMPVSLPPNVDPVQYRAALEFLQKNPDAAKQHLAHAQKMMMNPEFASQMVAMKKNMADPVYQQRLQTLKTDPELKEIFDEIGKGGQDVLSKYWGDHELMARISRKLGGVGGPPPNQPAPGKPTTISTLHEAARWNEIRRAKELIDGGADVNGKDARGVTPLGMAVGMNRIAVVKLLLDAKCKVDDRDGKGNTALHYAAGYGRPEICKMLIDAGADINSRNNDAQTPVDVAEINKETAMSKLLQEMGGAKSEKFV